MKVGPWNSNHSRYPLNIASSGLPPHPTGPTFGAQAQRMEGQNQHNYARIARAIDFIQRNYRAQPSLRDVAASVHLSEAHFQRLFTEWAGTSPKKFLQYITVHHAKRILRDRQPSLAEATDTVGLSSSSRLHDLFVRIEGMSPAEYRDGGASLAINYSVADSPFGTLLVAATPKGVCHLEFLGDGAQVLQSLRNEFPNATYRQATDRHQENALRIFHDDWSRLDRIKLHLRGTAFQLKVWEGLLRIPPGKLATYGHLAADLGHAKAARAVGTAIGRNPVAFVIPCHRVIQSSGTFGDYRWGPVRKTALIGWEAARTNGDR